MSTPVHAPEDVHEPPVPMFIAFVRCVKPCSRSTAGVPLPVCYSRRTRCRHGIAR
jgi:hypothetical protein